MLLDEVRQDLDGEQAALDALVAGLTAAQWARPTPSEGWALSVLSNSSPLVGLEAPRAQPSS